MTTARITFVSADGMAQVVVADCGKTLMQAARANGVAGVTADCGGELACSTCHCYVDAGWAERLPKATDDELAMLDFVWELGPCSRLTCQIPVTPELDGLLLRVPRRQL